MTKGYWGGRPIEMLSEEELIDIVLRLVDDIRETHRTLEKMASLFTLRQR